MIAQDKGLAITGIPFIGEHSDLNIICKSSMNICREREIIAERLYGEKEIMYERRVDAII